MFSLEGEEAVHGNSHHQNKMGRIFSAVLSTWAGLGRWERLGAICGAAFLASATTMAVRPGFLMKSLPLNCAMHAMHAG